MITLDETVGAKVLFPGCVDSQPVHAAYITDDQPNVVPMSRSWIEPFGGGTRWSAATTCNHDVNQLLCMWSIQNWLRWTRSARFRKIKPEIKEPRIILYSG